MNIYEKLLKVKESVDYLKKDTSGQQYSYVSSSQVLGTIRKVMNDVKLLLIPEIVGTRVSMKEELKADGKKTITYFTELDTLMTWVDVEKPEDKVIVRWYGQGVDIAGEKGVGKALTYNEKYFILKFFNIPTDKDDPDKFQDKYEDKPKPKPKGNLQNILKAIESAENMTKIKNIMAASALREWTEEEKIKIAELIKVREDGFNG